MEPTVGSQHDQEKPVVHKVILQKPGSEGIRKRTDGVVPQFSGMNFVQFFYPPGQYTSRSVNRWLIGIVRKPYRNEYCCFGNTRTRPRTISAGEVIVIEPKADYSTKISTRGEVDYLVLTTDRLKQALRAQHQNSPGITGSGETYFSSPLISPLLHTLISSAHRPASFDPHHADNFINAVVSGLCRPSLDVTADKRRFPNGLSPRDLRMLDEYIDAGAGRSINNAQLASLVNLPEAIFLRAFKRSNGETPYQYVLKRRIEHARILLGTTSVSIAEIAYSCGFSSQSHMTDVFRSRVGATPAALRKSITRI